MKGSVPDLGDYAWTDAGCGCAHGYLLPELDALLGQYAAVLVEARALDLGCGNGAVTAWLARRKGVKEVVGVEPSEAGIEQARTAHPDLEFYWASAYDPL